MPNFKAALPTPFVQKGVLKLIKDQQTGKFVFEPERFRLKIISPVEIPWNQKWSITLWVDCAKPRESKEKFPNRVRLILHPTQEQANTTLEWVNDGGKLFAYQSGHDIPKKKIVHFYVWPGLNNGGWLSLIVREI